VRDAGVLVRLRRMTTDQTWAVALAPVDSAESLALLRDYLVDVSDRYYRLHEDRDSTPAEIEHGLATMPSDHLAPPTGVFLVGRHDGVAASCAPSECRSRYSNCDELASRGQGRS
jgi:hypothetical protein